MLGTLWAINFKDVGFYSRVRWESIGRSLKGCKGCMLHFKTEFLNMLGRIIIYYRMLSYVIIDCLAISLASFY